MGIAVSSLLDFLEKNPSQQVSFPQMENELRHLSQREKIGTAVAVVSVVLGILSLGAVIVGGPFIMGALFAIALIAAAYSYCCRLAEVGLRNKVTPQMVPVTSQTPQQALLPSAPVSIE
jgi:hypothetical protein